MSTKSLERVVELWPSLSDEARADIVDLAEAQRARPVEWTADDLHQIEQGRKDLDEGRWESMSEFKREMDAFMTALRDKASRL